MITDIFARRYETVSVRTQYFQQDIRFMHQAADMIGERLWLGYKTEKPSDTAEAAIKGVHDALALELGRDYLHERWWFHNSTWNGNTTTQTYTNTYAQICKKFLEKVPPDLMDADTFIKERLSLVELAFRTRLQAIQHENAQLPAAIKQVEREDLMPPSGRGIRLPGLRSDAVRARNQRMNTVFAQLCDELNERMKLAMYPLTFHNGMIQFSTDETIATQVAKPFWTVVSAPMWKNVDDHIKEAVDRRDRSDRTAAFHAVCALESTIKIISDTKGWTHGGEKGAAAYIDNLGSQKNGRFIELWEAEMLKSIFSDVRNPFAHGPGQAAMPKLTDEQTDWAIDTSMSWIKSLIRRM